MNSLRVRLTGDGWGRGATIGLVLFALAAGVCLLDQDEGGPDLCLAMLAASLVVVLPAGLPIVGGTVGRPGAAAYAVALRVPHPPPWPTFLLRSGAAR